MSSDTTVRRPEWDLDRVAGLVAARPAQADRPSEALAEAVTDAVRQVLLTVHPPAQVATWLDAHAGADPAVIARKVLRLCSVAATEPPERCFDQRAPTVDADGALTDLGALEVTTEMLRGLLGCKQPQEVRAMLLRTVRRLGGRLVPASEAGVETILLDLSLGMGGPLFATPDPAGRAAARQLRRHLPQLLEDACRARDRLERTVRLAVEADLDALTGLPNRRAYERLAGRLGPGDVLILIDLDGFKAVNDHHGHLVGDEVLRILGSVLRDQVRIHEHAVRFGGDEFLVVLQPTGPDAGARFSERLRITWHRRRPLPVELSMGVAVVAGDVAAALENADRELDAAKARRGPQAGRAEEGA